MMPRRDQLGRRAFVVGAGTAGAGLLVGCGRLPWQAQEPARVPRIGFLTPGTYEGRAPLIEGLLEGLHELGYIDGQNIAIEYRFSEGNDERLPALAATLVDSRVDVIVSSASVATIAAQQATSTIPIVMGSVADPVASGIVASLAHTGNNVTGMGLISSQLMGKHLELLKLIVPDLAIVGLTVNPFNPVSGPELHEMVIATHTLGIQLQPLVVQRAEDFEVAFEAARSDHAQALVVSADALATINRATIASLAAKHRLPAIYQYREFVEVGGLLSYGPNLRESYRRAATYVDKILKGAQPTSLPVQQPMTFEFVVNMKTARELGITFPPEIQLQITEVIDG
jgi:putative ABC transport system substrate-binding protein